MKNGLGSSEGVSEKAKKTVPTSRPTMFRYIDFVNRPKLFKTIQDSDSGRSGGRPRTHVCCQIAGEDGRRVGSDPIQFIRYNRRLEELGRQLVETGRVTWNFPVKRNIE